MSLKGENVTHTEKKELRSRSKNELKRNNILMSASKLFCELGFSATSMDKVAKLAGVSKQTVYSHFGNKDDLFVASIVCKCEKFELLVGSQQVEQDPKTTLEGFANRFISMLLSDEGIAIHRVCASEAKNNAKVSELFFNAGPKRVIASLSECFERFNQQNLLNISDCHCAAIQFVSMIRGEAVMRREYNTQIQLTADEINSYIKQSIELFLRGYGYSEPSQC